MKQIRNAILRTILFCTTVLCGLLNPTLIFGQLGSVQSGATKSSAIQVDTSGTAGSEGFFNQEYLTGNWWGARSFLEDRGVNFDLRYSSTYQGLLTGTGNSNFGYGGKVNALIALETDKMGLWKGGNFNFHLEYRHGAAQTNLGGTLFSVNTALFLPSDSPKQLVATSINYTQRIGNGHRISIGKFNPIDIYASDPFYGGWGVDRFMNIVLVAPPSGLVPVVFMGAIASFNLKPVNLSVFVFDPKDRTNDYFPGDLFRTGVNLAINASKVTKISGRKTTYGITGIYSTAEGTDFSTIGNGVVNTSTKKGAFNINVQFKHNLQESSEFANAAWGLSFKAAISDGNPNYVRASMVAGLGGKALFFGRHQDSFGVGYFYYNLSDLLENSFNPMISIENESGLELYYNYSLTPWLYLGADLQYINPFRELFKNAFIGGLRTQIRI